MELLLISHAPTEIKNTMDSCYRLEFYVPFKFAVPALMVLQRKPYTQLEIYLSSVWVSTNMSEQDY